jgi:chemotaxis response regulator CheB
MPASGVNPGQGIAEIIKTQPDMQVVAEACDGEEAVAQFRLHRPVAYNFCYQGDFTQNPWT